MCPWTNAPLGPAEHCYVNRKGWHSINVQLICTSDYKITNVVARWPGSRRQPRNNVPVRKDTTRKNWITGYSDKNLCEIQLEDRNIGPVLRLKEQASDKPAWQEISHQSVVTKSYIALWDQLVVVNGVLYRWHESNRGSLFPTASNSC